VDLIERQPEAGHLEEFRSQTFNGVLHVGLAVFAVRRVDCAPRFDEDSRANPVSFCKQLAK
jgi:hypothetical protein